MPRHRKVLNTRPFPGIQWGNILAAQSISMRISILSDSAAGTGIYTETHAVTTNSLGLVNIEIGHGTPVSGSFTGINWSKGNYFIKVEADENAGTNFSLLGISQLLSVPYALYANSAGMLHLTDSQRDSIVNPSNGKVIFNLTSNCLNIWHSNNWYQVCGDCVPQPSAPNAGADLADCVDSVIQLSANNPVIGTGLWSVSNGIGGSFSNIHDPQSTFTGNLHQLYTLSWQIANSCTSLTDELHIIFNRLSPANAGPDQYIYNNNTYLAGNTPPTGNYGKWSGINGNNWNWWDQNDPNAFFHGSLGESYTLRWTTWNDCDTSFDDVVINFCPTTVTIADAGQDITVPFCTSILQANPPGEYCSGTWTIVNGSGGIFVDSTYCNTLFQGVPNTIYILRWSISTICDTSFDEVTVNTGPAWTCGAPGFLMGTRFIIPCKSGTNAG
ncbi:MAG: hypothetical protein NTU44_01910 [Bacteroidetes bacterium]|nr:hypothetical protein [Bacteroidota bacterium]